MRFSYGLGTISTAINPTLAIGMDGPAFYAARKGIDELKKSHDLFRVAWLNACAPTQLADESLKLLSHMVAKWNQTRLLVASMRIQGARHQRQPVATIAKALDITNKSVYKTISDGALAPAVSLLGMVGALMDRQLSGTPLEAP